LNTKRISTLLTLLLLAIIPVQAMEQKETTSDKIAQTTCKIFMTALIGVTSIMVADLATSGYETSQKMLAIDDSAEYSWGWPEQLKPNLPYVRTNQTYGCQVNEMSNCLQFDFSGRTVCRYTLVGKEISKKCLKQKDSYLRGILTFLRQNTLGKNEVEMAQELLQVSETLSSTDDIEGRNLILSCPETTTTRADGSLCSCSYQGSTITQKCLK